MQPTPYVLELTRIDRSALPQVGGKGANLGELTRIAGVRVPSGFCVSTNAYAQAVNVDEGLSPVEIRAAIEATPIPAEVRAAIVEALQGLGDESTALAVRSSATAEDLPTASFAGQQDSFLNVVGTEAVLSRVRQCWASLFTDRAVAYRQQHAIDPRGLRIAVIVQRMVDAEAAGVLFTADPVTGNRRVSTIDAVVGLGDSLVSGRVNADVFKVREGKLLETRRPDEARTLTDTQIAELETLGRTIEAHFGYPQDIEWCLAKGAFHVVQSRPITTLFPIPEDSEPHERRVYVSVGHQQMMTDPMKPLGVSFFQLNALGPKFKVGAGRLFVDVTPVLAAPASRPSVLEALGQSDPLIRDALTTLIDRGDFLALASVEHRPSPLLKNTRGLSAAEIAAPVEDPHLVRDLVARSEASLAALKVAIGERSGPPLFDFIRESMEAFKTLLRDPRSMAAITAAISASAWINEKMLAWLGEKNVADVITQTVTDNVTSEMGLALLDVADVVRAYPTVVAHLERARDGSADAAGDEGHGAWAGLDAIDGGADVRAALDAFFATYGMRGPGEIDITRPRWIERPGMLVPAILGNVKSFAHQAGRRRIEQSRRDALAKEAVLLERVERLPDGAQKAAETRAMIAIVRRLMGYREYPKYAMVNHYYVYKQALRREAHALVAAGAIDEVEEIDYLTFDELHAAVQSRTVDRARVADRKVEHASFEKLSPPRVITSDGEIIIGKYARPDLPPGALVGLAVSSGVVEGRARVVTSMADATLEPGDILVTRFTDPSWTPLFVAIRGLVTEVGGLMTHGAVVAREYGLPAVVGVEGATTRIKDGQQIRLDGTDGYVELL